MKKIAYIALIFVLVFSSMTSVFAENDSNGTATAVWSSIVHNFEGEDREIKITLTGVVGKQIDENRVAYNEYKVKYLDKYVDDTEFVNTDSGKPTWTGNGELIENAINVIPVVKGATLKIEVVDGKSGMSFPIGSYPILDTKKAIICNGTKDVATLETGDKLGFDRTFGVYYEPYIYQFPIDIQGMKLGIIVIEPKDYPVPTDEEVTALVNGKTGLDNFKDVNTYTASTFTDVPSEQWYAKSVATSYSLGIMGGKGNSIFDPMGKIKVSEAIAMVTRTRDIFLGNSGNIEKTGDEWYSGFVKYAIDNGIITEGQFENYDRNATRAELAYLFASALDADYYSSINSIEKLPDVQKDIQYGEEIFKLYNAGIVTGSDTLGTFNPTAEITRAEASAIINRVIKLDSRKQFSLD